jgi:phosphatidylserine/phosphatidylglycerophosphate/cardiolipin synthase-like enzyme
MRNLQLGSVLNVRAIAGTHVVTLAWDFTAGQEEKKKQLLGFAIERSEMDPNNTVLERYWLRGIKRFEFKDEGLPPGTPVPTSEHPIQSFQWGDYTPKPKTKYLYRVVPAYGKPKLLELDDQSSTTVEITTEAEDVGPSADGRPTHDIYFNRGVAGSQAYALRFGKTKPNETQPESEQMKWLSRGLFEALTQFIARASGKDYQLRAMLYEFHYLPVGEAFKKAHDSGADVAIRYEAQEYEEVNVAMIAAAKIEAICEPQKSRAGIRHNKFIVLIHKKQPVAVWTGSTNISAGGIFGHSNVGHVVWDPGIAKRYLAYWERLADADVQTPKLIAANLDVEPTPAPHAEPPKDRMLTLFCARDDKASVKTLHWYADVMASAKRVMCMTFAFNLDPMFAKVLERDGDTLRYAVFDKSVDEDVEALIDKTKNSVIAYGAKLEAGDLENFIGEVLTGFNRNRYIHDKFILSDPLGDDPVVVTGTANFSGASQYQNDENMLVIRGNTRVSDIYFGEFMRVFDHLYSRYIVAKLKAAGKNDPDAGFLKEDAQDWVPQNFKAGRKDLRRRYFMGG